MIKILRQNAMYFIDVEIADDHKDLTESTDLVVNIEGGADVAVRTRDKDNCQFRDFTIRSRVASGAKTELDKLREGFARWYLYAWELPKGAYEWILVDMDKVRESGILHEQWPEKPNRDGRTWFIAIPLMRLSEADAIVNLRLSGRTRKMTGVGSLKQQEVIRGDGRGRR